MSNGGTWFGEQGQADSTYQYSTVGSNPGVCCLCRTGTQFSQDRCRFSPSGIHVRPNGLEPPRMPSWRSRRVQGILKHHTDIPNPAFECPGLSFSLTGTCMLFPNLPDIYLDSARPCEQSLLTRLFPAVMCVCHVCPRLSTRPGTIGLVNGGPKDSFFWENLTIPRLFATPTEILRGWRYAVSGSYRAQGFSRSDRFRVNDEFQQCSST